MGLTDPRKLPHKQEYVLLNSNSQVYCISCTGIIPTKFLYQDHDAFLIDVETDKSLY